MSTPHPDWDDEFKRYLRMSYTIMSACWLGRRSPEEKAKIDAKRRADARAVDMILAGNPDPEFIARRQREKKVRSAYLAEPKA